MKKYYCLVNLLALFLFIACEGRKPDKQEELSSRSEINIQVPLPDSSKVDTTYYTQEPFKRGEYSYQKSQTEFKVGNDIYKAITEGYSLNDSSLIEVQRDSAQGKLTRVRITKAHNHVYKIDLTKNGRKVYSKRFTKLDFLKLENDGFIIESVPMAADFRGVTEDGRVLFDIWFGLPDSDFGGISFFSTDLKGNLLQLEAYSSTGGNGCDGKVHTSPNRKYFLTCHTLYGPKGYTFNFGKEDMVTASFLTDTTFVALYDYVIRFYNKNKKEWEQENDRTTDNLIIYHVNGSKLASYRYDGFFNELDYTAPIEKIPSLKQLALFDEEKMSIQLISLESPKQSKTVFLKDMEKLTKRVKKDTAAVEFYGIGRKYYLYPNPQGLSYHVSNNE